MPFLRTRVITDQPILDRVYRRRKTILDEMKALGFSDYYILNEEMFPLSVFPFFYVLIGSWLQGDDIYLSRRLAVSGYFPYLIHPTESCYGQVFSQGNKFGTAFDDGSILMSVNYDLDGTNEKRKYFRNVMKRATVEQLWEGHRGKINQFEAKGLRRLDKLTIEDIQAIEHRSDSVQLGLSEKKGKEHYTE
jgi:hypothetical protein